MAHLNIYLSKDREIWLRDHLETLARQDNRSLSYIVEEALVHFLKSQGKSVPHDKRKDHRRRDRPPEAARTDSPYTRRVSGRREA